MWLDIFMISAGANPWFWILMTFEGCWLFGSVKYENGWSAGLSMLIVAVALTFFGDFNVFSWILANPIYCLEIFGAYLIVGIVWSFVKWMIFCNDIRDDFIEVKKTFLGPEWIKDRLKGASVAVAKIPENLQEKWLEVIQKHRWHEEAPQFAIHSIKDIIPKASRYKATILFWMAYWPVSVMWALLHDFIERLFNRIYQFLSGAFQALANRAFAGIPDDIETANQKREEKEIKRY